MNEPDGIDKEPRIAQADIQTALFRMPGIIGDFLFDEITDGVYALDDDGIIRFANPALAHFLGFENISSIIGCSFLDFVHEDDFIRISALLCEEFLKNRDPASITSKIALHNGNAAWITVYQKGRFEHDGKAYNFGIIKDFSLIQRAKIAQMRSEGFYRSIVELTPDVVVVVDSQGAIEQANPKAIEIFGITEFQSKEKVNLFKLLVPEFRERAREDIHRVLQSGSLEDAEYQIISPDGCVLWGSVSARLIPAPEDDSKKTILMLIRNITKRKEREDHFIYLSTKDDMTGLFNRRGFALAGEQEIKHAFRRKEGMVLLFFDIDGFKLINDEFGHAEGDNAIRASAHVLRSMFRESDIVARWGGDEFVVLALDVPEGRISSLMQRLDGLLNDRDPEKDGKYTISFSIGTACYDPSAPVSIETLEATADEMMYKNKLIRKQSGNPPRRVLARSCT